MNRKTKAAEFLEEAYNISVSGRHVMVTQAMKDYAIEKVSKIERFSDRIIDIVITMDVHKLEHRVDIILKVDHTKIKSEAISNDMYASIDKAVRKLEAQLIRYKSKLNDHHQSKGLSAVDINVNVLRSAAEGELLDVNLEIEEENKRRLLDKYHPHQIVKREVCPLKTLTDGEALMKMDLSGDQFLVYRGEENLHLKVMYRRNDGDFGVIEPQG
ncbi:MAG: ribosome-associated translation inhibitor RaiA [Parachlamydiaceae bacterium]